MQSIESTALEPTRSELAGLSSGQKIARYIPVYGLVILTVLLIVMFSLLLPGTFCKRSETTIRRCSIRRPSVPTGSPPAPRGSTHRRSARSSDDPMRP